MTAEPVRWRSGFARTRSVAWAQQCYSSCAKATLLAAESIGKRVVLASDSLFQ